MDSAIAQFSQARWDLQFKTYNDILDVDSIDNPVVRKEVKSKFIQRTFSHINRFINNVQVMKYALATSKTNMITTCFKVNFDSTSCIYGYLHSRCHGGPKTTKVTHEFVCTGPTFRSQDGEYRHRFIRYDQFVGLFSKYAEVLSHVEAMVVDKISSGAMEFFVDFYYPQSCRIDTKYMNEFINNTRLAIKLYMIAWLRDFHYIHLKIPENHMNPAYQYIIYRPEDLSTYNMVMSVMKGDKKYEQMVDRIVEFYQNVDDPDKNIERLSCGQKIFPLTVIESIRTDDINYSVWREMYMTNLVSNLVLNLVTPSFPFLGSWFYIQNSHAGLFDNIAMFDKYKHSDIAGDVSRQLREIDKYNYYGKERQNGAINGKFLQLSRNINKAVIYADSDIRLTDLSVCVTSEYVGRTLFDIPNIIAQGQHLHGLDLIFTDASMFAKHMFEYVYAFYCMNTRLGIIHGDLHMNNVTIFRLYTMVDSRGRLMVKNPVIMYILAAEKGASGLNSSTAGTAGTTSYVFPHNGLFSMVIDLSRAVLGDVRRLENEFGPLYAEAYFRDQQNRLLHIINNNFPEIIASSQAAVTRLVMENFPLVFKILSCVDVFTVASNIKSMFSIDSTFKGAIKLAKGINERLEKLISRSSQLFNESISKAIRGEITSPDDIDWPNNIIAREVFADFARSEISSDENLTDVFRSDSELKYDIGDYDNWGPLVSLDPYFELWRKHVGKKSEEEGKIDEFLKDFSEQEEMQRLVLPYMKQEEDVLEFEPWMLQ